MLLCCYNQARGLLLCVIACPPVSMRVFQGQFIVAINAPTFLYPMKGYHPGWDNNAAVGIMHTTLHEMLGYVVTC